MSLSQSVTQYIITADCQDDKDIGKQFIRQNAGQEVLNLLLCRQKSNCSSYIATKFMNVLFGVNIRLEHLRSDVVILHSNH